MQSKFLLLSKTFSKWKGRQTEATKGKLLNGCEGGGGDQRAANGPGGGGGE